MNIKNFTKILTALDDTEKYNEINGYYITIGEHGTAILYRLNNGFSSWLSDENLQTSIEDLTDKITHAFLSELNENTGDKK